MPIKVSLSESLPQKRRVTLETIVVTEQHWHPSCGKQPNKSISTAKIVRESPAGVPPLVTDSAIIGYQNSQYKRFNPCVHIEARYGANNQSCRFLSSSDEVTLDDRPLNTGCSKYQYNYEKLTTSATLKFDFASYLNGDCLEPLPTGGDDYMSAIAGSDSLVNDLAKLAVAEFIPKLDDGFSVPQFLFELIEMKMLWKQISRLWEIHLGLTANSRDLADQYLGYNFGIAPLVDDIKKLVRKMRTANDAVFDFINNADKRMTLHYEKKLSPTYFKPSSWFDPTPISTSLYHTSPNGEWYFARDTVPVGFTLHGVQRRTITDLEYHATMDFSYHLPSVGPALKSFLASLDHFGINLSISDVWEVIPFSFMVDWFFDVGSFLEQFDMSNLPVTVVVNDFCHSFKYKRKNEIEFTSVTPSNWTPLDTTLSIEKECYYRWPAIPPPPTNALGEWEWPKLNTRWGLFRISIASALAATRQPYSVWFANGGFGEGDIIFTKRRR